MSKKTIVLILLSPIALFLALQLVPVWLAQNNPPVVAEPQWDSEQTHALLQRACYDCHSNETVWPWYSRVAPISWLITFDVIRGRNELNFSEWGTGQGEFSGNSARIAQRLAREISEGNMPPASYVNLHPTAQLSDAEKQQLIDGLQASFK